MKREEIISKLKLMFIDTFAVGVEVKLKKPIKIDHSWDVGYTYLSKIRWNGEDFEWYKDTWGGGWQTSQSIINKHALEIFPDALDVKVKTETEYFIDD